MNRVLIFTLLWGIFIAPNSLLYSQNSQITLLDADNSMPIEGVAFQYGNQNGVSNNEGVISFKFIEKQQMQLSHINYGKWQWTAEEVAEFVQNKIYYAQSKTVSLYPVTVIAVKSGQDATERVKIGCSDRMNHDGGEILNQIPAINSIRKGGNYGFDPVFRGFKYDQLNIVLNGAQSATAACPNRMDPPTSQMAPNMMDRIEVYKGPHALRYGTGFGGTINFVPSKLRFTTEPDIYGRISSGYKLNGSVFQSEGQIGLSNKRYDLSLFAAWSQGDNYYAGNGDTIAAGFQRGSFGANLGLKLTDNQQLRLSATYNVARDADFPALPMDLRTDDTWMFNLNHDIRFIDRQLKTWKTTLFGSFVDHFMDNRLKELDPRMMDAETAAKTKNYGGRTEGKWQFNQDILYVGLDTRSEGAEGTRVREFLMGPMAGNILEDNAWQNGQISKTGLFAEYHLNKKNLQFVFSGRLNLNLAKINDATSEFEAVYDKTSSVQINPNLSVGIQKPLNDNMKLSLWLGRAQRSGSLTERFINYFPVGLDPYEMLGNPELKPENNNQADISFEFRNEQTVINLDVFASYMQNYISSAIDTALDPRLPTSPGVRQYMNIDEAFKTGFEVTWLQKLPYGLQSQIGVAYTYAQDLALNEPLPEIPPLDLRIGLNGSYLDN
ncbi:MAG: TonB-dependent receptor, partial [Salinivirgaceae bacterium]